MTDISSLEASAAKLSEAAQRSKAAAEVQHKYVHGDENTDVQTESGLVPSLAKQVRLVWERLAELGMGIFQAAGLGAIVRTFQEKMRDTLSVKDFGAVGDGEAEDTAAFVRAGPGAYRPQGTYKVDPAQVDIHTYRGPGSILALGQLFKRSTDDLLSRALVQRLGGVPQFGFVAPDGSDSQIYPGAGNATQGIAWLLHNGVEKLYITQRVSGASWGADERVIFSEWRWLGNGGSMSVVAFTEPLSVGHGSDLSVLLEDGEIWLYTTAGNAGSFEGGTSLGGKGFSKVKWRGAATSQADVQRFEVFGNPGDGTRLHWPQRSSVCVTNDGKHVILVATSYEGTGRFFFLYDRAEVEAAGIDARHVAPVLGPVPFERAPGEFGSTLQGMTSDGKHLYTVWGAGAPRAARTIQIYDMSGRLRRSLPYAGPAALYTEDQLMGITASGIPVSFEPEGICLRGDELLTLAIDAWKLPGDVVSSDGFNWASMNTTPTAGKTPTTRANWVVTKLPANKAYASDTLFAAGAYLRRDKRIMRIKVPSREAGEVKLQAASTDATTGTIKEYFPGMDIGFNAENGSFTIGKFWEALGRYRKFLELNYDNNLNLFSTAVDELNTRWVSIKSAWGSAMYGLQLRSSGGQTAQGGWVDLHANDCPNSPGESVVGSGLPSVGVRLRCATITAMVATTEGLIYYGSQFIRATTDNVVALGRSLNRFSVVWAGTGVINTSDARLKTPVEPFSLAHLRAGIRLVDELGLYRWLQKIEEEQEGGDVARYHAGQTVQRAIEIFQEEGVDPFQLAAVCYDKWDEHYEVLEPALYDDKKVLIQPEIVQLVPAGDRFSFRDHQLAYLLMAAMAWRQRTTIEQQQEVIQVQQDMLRRLEALEAA
jgi:hypothetical protein